MKLRCPYCFCELTNFEVDLKWRCRRLYSSIEQEQAGRRKREEQETEERLRSKVPAFSGFHQKAKELFMGSQRENENASDSNREISPAYCPTTYDRRMTSCPSCGESSRREALCSVCCEKQQEVDSDYSALAIPEAWLRGKGLSLGIAGLPGAGKDAIIAALYLEIERSLSNFGLLLDAVNGGDKDSRESLNRLVEAAKRMSPGTPTDISREEESFVFPLSYLERGRFFSRSFGGDVLLHLKNNAGGSYEDSTLLAEHATYLGGAKGLIILLEPSQFRNPLLTSDTRQNIGFENQKDTEKLRQLSENIFKFLEIAGCMKWGRYKYPVVVCINKWDKVLDYYLRGNSQSASERKIKDLILKIEEKNPRSWDLGYADLTMMSEQSELIEQLISKNLEEDLFMKQMKARCKNIIFKTISCKQDIPEEKGDDKIIYSITPWRVIDALAFILYHNRAIRGT